MIARVVSGDGFFAKEVYLDAGAAPKNIRTFLLKPVIVDGIVINYEQTKEERFYEFIIEDEKGVRVYREVTQQTSRPNPEGKVQGSR